MQNQTPTLGHTYVDASATDGGGDQLSVIVPCYNESATLETLLRSVRSILPRAEVIVVDDGSTDRSLDIAQALASELNLRVIAGEENRGKGAVVRDGIHAVSRRFVAIQDADLEYDPVDLKSMYLQALADPNEQKTAVYGSRYLQSGKAEHGSVAAYLATRLLAVIQLVLYGRWMSDPTTCYKLFNTEQLRRLNLSSTGFELCAEMNAKWFRLKLPIHELPITYQPRSVAEGKKISAVDFFRLLAELIRWRFMSFSNIDPPGIQHEPPFHYVVARLAIGTLLMFSGLEKVITAQPLSIASTWMMSGSAVAGWGAVECLLGWVTLSFIAHRSIRLMLTLLFSLFTSLLLLQWWHGATQCQCLGDSAFPIVGMIALDSAVLGCLIVQRRWWDRSSDAVQGILGELVRHGRFAVPALLAISVLLFGSPRAGLDYLAGNSILIQSKQQFVGRV